MKIRHHLFGLALAFAVVSSNLANAASAPLLRIRVVSAEAHRTDLSADVSAQQCDLANYSGYCHGTRTESIQNVLQVESSDGASFSVSCTVDTRWSKCQLLPVGASFDARREKHGITIFFADDEGRPRKQFYSFAPPKKLEASTALRKAE